MTSNILPIKISKAATSLLATTGICVIWKCTECKTIKTSKFLDWTKCVVCKKVFCVGCVKDDKCGWCFEKKEKIHKPDITCIQCKDSYSYKAFPYYKSGNDFGVCCNCLKDEEDEDEKYN